MKIHLKEAKNYFTFYVISEDTFFNITNTKLAKFKKKNKKG